MRQVIRGTSKNNSNKNRRPGSQGRDEAV